MTEATWKSLLRSLPRGLSYKEAATRLRIPYQQVRSAIQRHKYPVVDGRSFSQHTGMRWRELDWSQSNIALARLYGVSRERVRVMRAKLRKPFVESRGRPRKQR